TVYADLVASFRAAAAARKATYNIDSEKSVLARALLEFLGLHEAVRGDWYLAEELQKFLEKNSVLERRLNTRQVAQLLKRFRLIQERAVLDVGKTSSCETPNATTKRRQRVAYRFDRLRAETIAG